MKQSMLHKILLFTLLVLFLPACRAEPGTDALPPSEVARAVLDSQAGLPAMEALVPEDEAFSAYVEQYYGLAPDTVEDGIIYYAGGVDASEIAVLRLTEDGGTAESALQDYIASRAGDFLGYVPAQAAMAERGLTAVSGRTAALLICPEPEEAQAAFFACFGETPPVTEPEDSVPPPEETQPEEPQPEEPQPKETQLEETPSVERPPEETQMVEHTPLPAETDLPVEPPPETVPSTAAPETVPPEEPLPETVPPEETAPPMTEDFDPAAIVEVWRSGESGRLSEKNQLILDRCSEVIAANIRDGMSEYEKELAIHDWMIGWAEYDPEASSHAPDASPDPDNENPYGLLYQRVGICRGYSSTFQLFMDLLGIECITVEGTAYNGSQEHAWNMVKLDGEWYCVDVTWDDPTGDLTGWTASEAGRVHHRFFNVTSQKLRDTNHQWDESSVPEATATVYSWKE